MTTEYGDGERQITETLMAVQEVGLPAIVLWPNADAGSEDIAGGIRKFREHEDDSRLHFFKNLPTNDYIRLMSGTACIVGNSSSAIREGSFIGTPAVNIGSRQAAASAARTSSTPATTRGDRGRDPRPARARPATSASRSTATVTPVSGSPRSSRLVPLSTVKRMTY